MEYGILIWAPRPVPKMLFCKGSSHCCLHTRPEVQQQKAIKRALADDAEVC
jgi:hypothetical protein